MRAPASCTVGIREDAPRPDDTPRPPVRRCRHLRWTDTASVCTRSARSRSRQQRPAPPSAAEQSLWFSLDLQLRLPPCVSCCWLSIRLHGHYRSHPSVAAASRSDNHSQDTAVWFSRLDCSVGEPKRTVLLSLYSRDATDGSTAIKRCHYCDRGCKLWLESAIQVWRVPV